MAHARANVSMRMVIYEQEFVGVKDARLPAFIEVNSSDFRAGEKTIQVGGQERRYREYSLSHWVVECGQNPLTYSID